MFGGRGFVQSRRRSTEQLVIQFVLLATTCFVCLIGVIAFMHFSSPVGQAAPAPIVPSFGIADENVDEFIVPLDNIQPGTPLESSMFKRERRAGSLLGPEIIRHLDETRNLYSRGLLLANQPINRDQLTGLQPINVLTASIPAGYRAVSIPVDAVASVEGWAQPGARVDVVWITNIAQKRTAAIIAPNAKVISANRQTEGGSDEGKKEEGGIPNTVTLLVSNRDALKVRLASMNGRLALILRGIEDTGATPSGRNSVNEPDLTRSPNLPQAPARNLTEVWVTDKKTGQREKRLFENGVRVEG